MKRLSAVQLLQSNDSLVCIFVFFFPRQAAIIVENFNLYHCKPRHSWFATTVSVAAIKNKVSSKGVGGEIAPRS